MLKNYRLIAMVLVFAASNFGAFAQTNETNNYKDVLLNGKPAKLNLTTGEVTYVSGEIAKSRAAKKLKDSLLSTRTEIQTNLIKDIVDSSESSKSKTDFDVTSTNLEEDNLEVVNSEITESSMKTSEEVPESFTNETPVVASETLDKVETDKPKDFISDFHMVKEGENLYLLSKRYQTTLRDLIIANKLETTVIQPGQTLRVRNFDFSESEITWTVTKGETLYSIAKKNNTSVEELKNLNGLTTSLIKVGQKLQVNQNSTLSKK